MAQFHTDALTWLTNVRGGNHVVSREERQQLFFGPESTTNRWLSSSARQEIAPPVDDIERDAESAELVQERLRRRAMPLKSLLLRSAPPPPAGEAASSMAVGFDAVDTRAFASNVGSLFALPAKAAAAAAVGVRKAAARQALTNVQSQSELSSSAAQRAGQSVGAVRLGDDGSCSAVGMRTVGAIDELVKQLTTRRLDVCVTSIDVSQSGAMQRFDEREGPLMARIVPLCYLRDELPWLRVTVLIADSCQIHDYCCDHLARALREPSCCLEKVSLRNNLITDDGADRLKKAIKYNSRITEVALAGNPAVQKPSEKGRQILALMDERLAANRRRMMR